MPTIGTMSNYLENKLINHLLRNTTYTPPSTLWVALYTISPNETRTGTEISAASYSRKQVTFDVSGSTATNSSTITFTEATESWGTIVGVSVMDASSSGNILFFGDTENHMVVNSGETYSINAGMLKIELVGSTKGGWGDGMPENMLKHVLKNTSYTSPGTDIYLALGNTLVTDASYTFVSWTEISTSGTGYSRKKVTSWYSPDSGSTCNLADVVFASPPISVEWGEITHIVIFDAATSGNALLWGKLRTRVYIIDGDGFKFETGNINILLN